MAENETEVTFRTRDFGGSRFRCLLATSLPQPKVAGFLNSLVQPLAEVGEGDWYMPEGFCKPDEAKLGETSGFLTDEQREDVTNWWLAVRHKANTPNWGKAERPPRSRERSEPRQDYFRDFGRQQWSEEYGLGLVALFGAVLSTQQSIRLGMEGR